MSSAAIKIHNVEKSFKRFIKPSWAAMDALGLPVPSTKFDIFHALININLEIKPGERVALIGRNGAGKSTLLRLVSGQMKPDSGVVVVSGKIQALMELGTGFHPDFTGIENIRASMAYHGVSEEKLKKCVNEIIEFTELGEFINRPVREYSSGMYSRLAFAVSTSISPEILIIDEVLGAGDAYFIGKCIQRMKTLTEGGTTVLFVSHDISSVQMLCDRAVWLDHGKIIQDGPILPVGKAYLAAVRAEEEVRVRAQNALLTKNQAKNCTANSDGSLFRLIGEGGMAPKKAMAVSVIRYGAGNSVFGEINHEVKNINASEIILDETYMNWRVIDKKKRIPGWEFGDFGGLYHHAPWKIEWPVHKDKTDRWLEIDYLPSPTDKVIIELFDEDSSEYMPLAEISAGTEEKLQTIRIDVKESMAGTQKENYLKTIDLQSLSRDERYGSGEIIINGFGFFDEENERRHTLVSGENVSAVISYEAANEYLNPVAVIAIYKPDGSCAMQIISNRNGKEIGAVSGRGFIKFSFNPFMLGEGDYIVSVAMFKELNLASKVEPPAYDLHDRCYVMKVLPPEGIAVNLGIVNQPSAWEIVK